MNRNCGKAFDLAKEGNVVLLLGLGVGEVGMKRKVVSDKMHKIGIDMTHLTEDALSESEKELEDSVLKELVTLRATGRLTFVDCKNFKSYQVEDVIKEYALKRDVTHVVLDDYHELNDAGVISIFEDRIKEKYGVKLYF